MRKAIILLLVASMLSLTSCSNKSVEANTSTAESNTSSVVSADVSSVVSAEASSENVSSEDSVSSVASENTKSTKTKSTTSENSVYSSKAERIKTAFRAYLSHSIVTPEKCNIENNPALVDFAKYYEQYMKAMGNRTIKSTVSMDKAELEKHRNKIRCFLNDTIKYAHIKDWKESIDSDEIIYFCYFGKVDDYNLFAINFTNGDMLGYSYFNRLAGYQFMGSPYINRSCDYDKYGNCKTTVKETLNYSGIVLEKGGKYYTMEDLYIDNVISAETVGKIYNTLPKELQMGVFEDYKDVYNLTGFWLYPNSSMPYFTVDDKDKKVDFISYYDKDGKFHVVY